MSQSEPQAERPAPAVSTPTPPALSGAAKSLAAPKAITFRAVLLGLLLIPFNIYGIVRLEMVLYGPYCSTVSLFPNVIFLLFLLVGGNGLVRRLSPKKALRQSELMTVYIMLSISTGIGGEDGIPLLNQFLPYATWYGHDTGQWDSFLNALPSWMLVRNYAAVRGHYLGESTLWRWETLKAWLIPASAWIGVALLLLWTSVCIAVLFRRQWQDKERMSFPIILLPMEMTEPTGRLYRSSLMWSGFVFAASLELYNGLAFLYPSLPRLPLTMQQMASFFTVHPWDAIKDFPITLYPFAIGLAYLLPLDLLFSCVFFFFFWKGQAAATAATGYDITPDFPFIREQAFGAVMGLAATYIWTARRSLHESLQEALGRRNPKGGTVPEGMSPRQVWTGIALGLTGLIGFCLSAGMQWWLAVPLITLFFAFVIVILRIRAELGAPIHDLHYMGPDMMLPRIFGVSGWRGGDLAMVAMFWLFNRAHRGDTPPVAMEGLFAARQQKWEARRVVGVVALAMLVSAVCAFWTHEHLAFRLGETSRFSYGSWAAGETFSRLEARQGGVLDANPNGLAMGAMGVGLVSCLGLMWARLRFIAFPLHPLGYILASSYAIHLLWLPFLVAGLVKAFVLRMGGLRAYRRLLPFFFGVIIGDCLVGCGWALVSLLTNTRMYNFFGE